MFCAKCGKEVPENIRFCAYCGAPIIMIMEKKETEHAETSPATTANTANPATDGVDANPATAVVAAVTADIAITATSSHRESSAIVPIQPVLLYGKFTEEDKWTIRAAVIMMIIGLGGALLCMMIHYTEQQGNSYSDTDNSVISNNEYAYENNYQELYDDEYAYKNEYGRYVDYGILEDYDICGSYTGAGSISGVEFNIYTSDDSEYVGNVNGVIGSSENRDMSYGVDGEIRKITDNVYRLETQYGTVYDFCAYKDDYGEIMMDVFINYSSANILDLHFNMNAMKTA